MAGASVKRELVNAILNSVKRSKEMTKEVNRVISMANKRIDRIRGDGKVVSPSVDSLTVDRFSLRGQTWEEQKQTYFNALAFMNQDTSTLGGARSYTNSLIEQVFKVDRNTVHNNPKYYKYFHEIYEEYIQDNVSGEMTGEPLLDTNMVGQYFYDLKVDEARNAVEEETREAIEEQNAREREQAEEIANGVIMSLEDFAKGMGGSLE